MSKPVDVQCEACGASYRVEAHLRTASCPYCDSPAVVERPPSADRPDPAFVLPFVVDERGALAKVERWVRRAGLFSRSGMKRASIRKTRAVYVPAWLYGAIAESDYEADIGESYSETVRTGKGTRTQVRTEWRPLSGRRSAYVRDVFVSASKGLPNEELEAVEPYDSRGLRRYEPALVSGWIAEEPTLPLEACRQQAHQESLREVERELEAFLPGDRHRNLRHSTRLEDEVIDLVLLPVWVFAARYAEGRPPVRVVVNGQTGKLWGKMPYSWRKILLAVVLGLGLVGITIAVLVALSS